MAGINVLSDTLKGGNKLEKTSTPKGKKTLDSPETPAAGFAEVLSGSIKLKANSKGQNSKASRNLEDEQSAKDPVQSALNQKESGTMLEYGNFLLPFFTQQTLESDLPAGKEANSGNVVNQGTGIFPTAISSLSNVPQATGNNLGLDMLNLLSLVSDEISAQSGMTEQKSQGITPKITELDQYRQVVVNLLEKLSGEIKDISSNATPINSESGMNNLSQDMVKVVQGWITAIDKIPKDGQSSREQMGTQLMPDVLSSGIGTYNSKLTAKLAALLADLSPQQSQGNEGVEPFIKQVKGLDFNATDAQIKDLTQLTNAQKNTNDLRVPENKITKVLQEPFHEEVLLGNSKPSAALSKVKDVQNLNLGAGVGIGGIVSPTNVAEGKTESLPVWDQISTILREQTINRPKDLKQLDIQLHPAELGNIQIDLHWENGQVHLRVQASETTTGQLLQNHLSDLRQALTNQGVNCGTLQMGQGGERQQNSRRDEPRTPLNQNTHLINEDEEQILGISPVTHEQVEQNGLNQINVTA